MTFRCLRFEVQYIDRDGGGEIVAAGTPEQVVKGAAQPADDDAGRKASGRRDRVALFAPAQVR
jgi:hypothetical protein